jgi:transcriptional regulator with GAF, ATPase, and Fis domain
LAQAEQVAETDSTVLILGETGSGKELLAQAIHDLSPRAKRPMVTVNCAALPPTLIEAELFGRERGAYTGASNKQVGRFELAHGTTLFLDEVGELPPELQAKLLRVLQQGKFERLGGIRTITVDVRVIAATNSDLAARVKRGDFRDDLFYRLNVFPIRVPPLRERREDIPPLVWTFVREFSERMGKSIERIPQRIMSSLCQYPWPGNVRELRNVIERAMILAKNGTLLVPIPDSDETTTTLVTLAEMEIGYIGRVMEQTGWRVRGPSGAAEILGLKPTTLESRMKKLGIRRGSS